MSRGQAKEQEVLLMVEEFRVLCLDGGGIKGVFPAKYIALIEEKLDGRIADHFDLICGTSTGGILALALSIKRPAKEIVNLYLGEGANIFPKKGKLKRLIAKVLGHIYDPSHLEQVLKDKFTDETGSRHVMKDATTMLCIQSVNISTGKTQIFKTPHSVCRPIKETFHYDSEICMWEVAMASSAATGYFPPSRVENSYYVDGGFWANNPSLVGINEAIRCGKELPQIKLLSIGTGRSTFHIVDKVAKRLSVAKWFRSNNMIEFLFDIQSQASENIVAHLLGEERYCRINAELGSPLQMDDVDNTDFLVGHAEQQFKATWEDVNKKFFGGK